MEVKEEKRRGGEGKGSKQKGRRGKRVRDEEAAKGWEEEEKQAKI